MSFLICEFLFAQAVATGGTRPDPYCDAEMWSSCGCAPAPVTRSIGPALVARSWLVVPGTNGGDAASVLARWVLDPRAPSPSAPSTSTEVASSAWIERQGIDAGEVTCAFTTIFSELGEVRMARLSGAGWMLFNGAPVLGDPERRGLRGAPVVLRAGENRIFVAANGVRFDLELWKPATSLVIEPFDIGWPVAARDEDVTYPIFNATTTTERYVHVHYGHAVTWTGSCKPNVQEWRDGGYIAPLAMQLGASYYDLIFDECGREPWPLARCDVYVPICVYGGQEGGGVDRRLLRRNAEGDESIENNFENVKRGVSTPAQPFVTGFSDDAVHVYGMSSSLEHDAPGLIAARFAQARAWYANGVVPTVVLDVDYLEACYRDERMWLSSRVRGHSVVLHGNADDNIAWSKLVTSESGFDVRANRARVDGVEYVGEDLAGWKLISSHSPKLLALWSTGERGARLAHLLTIAWRGERTESAVFRAHDASPGWIRLDADEPR